MATQIKVSKQVHNYISQTVVCVSKLVGPKVPAQLMMQRIESKVDNVVAVKMMTQYFEQDLTPMQAATVFVNVLQLLS